MDDYRFGGTAVSVTPENCAEKLARFFPRASAIRVPVRVTAVRAGRPQSREAAVLEFGEREHAIFVTTLPLEFDDRVRLEREQPDLATDAEVIAVQYHQGSKAVAVRFLPGPCEWVIQA